MADIVERLKLHPYWSEADRLLHQEAAEEIRVLRARLERAEREANNGNQ